MKTKIINEHKNMVTRDLENFFDNESKLHKIAGYHMGFRDKNFKKAKSYPGKMFRPLLLLNFNSAFGGNSQEALPAASAIQIFHDFSLVHDDIEDNDEKRRGKPTVWSLWGMPQGINTGDLMFNLSFKSALRTKPDKLPSVMEILTSTYEKVVYGQSLDIDFAEKKISEVSLEEYREMIEGKTASLIETSCALGAFFAEKDERIMAKAADYGKNIGLVHQEHDDYMGLWGSEKQTGKKEGCDIREKKKTYPILLAYKKGNASQKKKLTEIYGKKVITPKDHWKVLDILEELNVKKDVLADVTERANKARKSLYELNLNSFWENQFEEIIEKITKKG